mmetsp:Transcript_33701/g.32168  ORF Transcript_33701/g.32168 Transcript_33701/m.32168 type:complete len:209 (-) Transcript_33701:957-1583(-)
MFAPLMAARAPDMTRTGQANWEIPLASKSISINSFNNKALTAIVIPINKGKYALFIAYNLPPKNPPASPPTAAPAPNTAIREVASCIESFSSVARKSWRWADNTPQGTVLGIVCTSMIATVGIAMLYTNVDIVNEGKVYPLLRTSVKSSSFSPLWGSLRKICSIKDDSSAYTPIIMKGYLHPNKPNVYPVRSCPSIIPPPRHEDTIAE